jgi:hypothetical protein
MKLKFKYICKIYLDRVSGYYIDCDLNTNVKIQTLLYQHPSLERGLVLKLSDDYFFMRQRDFECVCGTPSSTAIRH